LNFDDEINTLRKMQKTGITPAFLGVTSVRVRGDTHVQGVVMEYVEKSLVDVWFKDIHTNVAVATSAYTWLEGELLRVCRGFYNQDRCHGDLSHNNLMVKVQPRVKPSFAKGVMTLVAIDVGMAGRGWAAGTFPYSLSTWFSHAPLPNGFNDMSIDVIQAVNVCVIWISWSFPTCGGRIEEQQGDRKAQACGRCMD
jgi:hypothetical protein